MDATQFKNSAEHRNRLSEFLSDDTISTALGIVQMQLACKPVPFNAPEIMSVRAHAHYMGMKDAVNLLINLSIPNPAPQEVPDATYLPEQ